MSHRLPRIITLALVGLAAVLHAYEQLSPAEPSPSVEMFLWAMMPYPLCLALLFKRSLCIPAAVGAMVALVVDLFLHYSFFVLTPKGSTAVLALAFMPLWSTVFFVPITILLISHLVPTNESTKDNVL